MADRQTDFTLSGRGTKMIPISRPRVAVGRQGGIYYVYRDIDRGSRVSLAYTSNPTGGTWLVKDLTDFSVDAWEPSYDTNLWSKRKGCTSLCSVLRRETVRRSSNRPPNRCMYWKSNQTK